MSGIPTSARLLVQHRSAGRCERCGQRKPLEMSHRVAKGMGGSNVDQGNPALYCHLCHECHAWVEAWPKDALLTGYKAPGLHRLHDWPVRMHDGWAVLDEDGDFEFTPRLTM